MSFVESVFYRLDSPPSGALGEWLPSVQYATDLCPRFPEDHAAREWRESPLVVRFNPGVQRASILWTCYSECLMHHSLLEALPDLGLTGVETLPATVWIGRERLPKGEYSEIRVSGWGGLAHPESGIAILKECPECGRREYSGIRNPEKIVDTGAWDGSDFFMVWPMPKSILITRRAAEALKQIARQPTRGYVLREIGSLRADGFTPGRLSSYMPIERAFLLGESLGIT